MIIDSLRDYMRNLKCLDTFNNAIRVNVNYLEANADTYSIRGGSCRTYSEKIC